MTTQPKQQQAIPDSASDWSQTITFNQFDPSLGALQAIEVGLTADVAGAVAIESLEAAPASVSVALSGLLTVKDPAGTALVSAAPDPSAAAHLGAYDGSADFAGASGIIFNGLSAAVSSGAVLSPSASGMQDFVGTGTVALPVTATTRLHVSGPANLQVASRADAGATVSLGYDYGSSGGDSGSTFGSDLAAIALIQPSLDFVTVTTQPQVFAFADATTGWSSNLPVRQFNPALGTLEAVKITVAADIAGSVAAEDLGTAGSAFVTQTAAVTVGQPGSFLDLAAAPSVNDTQMLAAFDGTADFAGTSGQIDQGLTNTATMSSELEDTAQLAAFTGTGTVSVPIATTSSATLDGPANLVARLLAQAGATVSVSYTYRPADIPPTAVEWVDPILPSAHDQDVAITLPGTYTASHAPTPSIGSLVIDSPGAVLVLDTNLAISGNFILDAGTVVFNGTTLSAADISLNGGTVTGDTVALDAAGTIVIGAVGLAGVLTAGTVVPISASATDLTAALGGFIATDSTATLTPIAVGTAPPPLEQPITPLPTLAASSLITAGGVLAPIPAVTSPMTVAADHNGMLVFGSAGPFLFDGGATGANTVVGGGGASTLFGGSGGGNVLAGGSGAATIVGSGGGNDLLMAGGSSALLFGGSGSSTVVGGSGLSTVAGGSGQTTVFAGSGGLLAFGGTGPLTFVGGLGASTVVSGTGAATLFGGGHDQLYADGGSATLVGAAAGGDLLAASSGTALLVAGGADTLMAGSGNAQMIGGAGADLFAFVNGAAGGNAVIWNFTQGADHVGLFGYAPNVVQTVLASAATGGGATTITLPDNTKITFGNITHLGAADFA